MTSVEIILNIKICLKQKSVLGEQLLHLREYPTQSIVVKIPDDLVRALKALNNIESIDKYRLTIDVEGHRVLEDIPEDD